ncbi:MAG: hypothetical protein HY021_08920 [Burkholderiales bacterium]|nr:hypothetical protein [Burkholderiales bacterium]
MAAFLAIVAAAVPGPAAAQALPAWMAGSWCTATGADRGEEVWLAPAGGLMLGMSRTLPAGTTRRLQFEFLRIELQDGVPTYLAQPQGRPAVAFRLAQADDRSASFRNPAHDFPQRIDYRSDGDDRLHAEIAGAGRDGKERVIAFDFVACGLNAGAK